MTNHKKMYLNLFNAITDTIKLLQTAKQEKAVTDAIKLL